MRKKTNGLSHLTNSELVGMLWVSSQRTTQLMTSIIRLILLILVVTTFGGLLSGCHPCSIPGVCKPQFSTEEIVAFMGKDGAVYFDIPARKNYQRAELQSISIYRVEADYREDTGEFAIPYWGTSKRGYTDQGKRASEELDLPWPLRYGQTGLLTEIKTPPKAIENGKYRIHGSVWLYDEKGGKYFKLSGRFRYENGSVRDFY